LSAAAQDEVRAVYDSLIRPLVHDRW
jgi:hypothetical protein